MSVPFIDRIDAAGSPISLAQSGIDDALRQGEAFHRVLRTTIKGDYVSHLRRMSEEGARVTQLFHENEVRAIAIWRTFLTTYCGRRFEIDDLVTAEAHRSKGYGATLIKALEGKARSLSCNYVMLTSATWRVDAHRFYFRERYVIDAFLFIKHVVPLP
jgi:GNAT superfamily N-acetyltransferase